MTDKTFTPEQITSAYEEWVGKDLTAANLVDFVRAFGVTVVDSEPTVPVGTAGTVTHRNHCTGHGFRSKDGYYVAIPNPDGSTSVTFWGDHNVVDFAPDPIFRLGWIEDLDDDDTVSVGSIRRWVEGGGS